MSIFEEYGAFNGEIRNILYKYPIYDVLVFYFVSFTSVDFSFITVK